MKQCLFFFLFLSGSFPIVVNAGLPVSPPYDGSGSAKYHVPTTPDLAPFADYTLPGYSAHLKNGNLEISYELPLTLTGLENHESFSGAVQNGVAVMRGNNGTMNCDVNTKMCKVKYTDINFDLVQVQKQLSPLNLSSQELDAKLSVAARFGGDLEGEIYLPAIDGQ